MSATIFVKELCVHGRHGVLAEENILGQKFYFDITCKTDFADCVFEDDVSKTTNYDSLCSTVVEVSNSRSFRLLETLADRIAAAILKQHHRVHAVTVRINKPSAPICHVFGAVGVEITRSRHA
ncbi:dihydroneopterin aldolase [Rhizobium leguminosarum]|uniref:dihydroneopterin aldolase n=1 Tax=Rhizobium leguminosarum TaxID=384 RepID=UPI00160C21FF|nr:dihydroneopterin aldolase [Rhizobium leguminosarum]MBB6296064.1 dihydroneopterin aldolase [Rhizobium leguminosarum]